MTRHSASKSVAPLYAALDLGTHNCRLLVARPAERGFRVVDSFANMVRLGEGLSGCGQLSEAAMARTIDTLHICADKIRCHAPACVQCVATAACRLATNGADFVARIAHETGLEVEIITPRCEAELGVESCRPLFDTACAHGLVFDIGGGSCEVTRLDRDTDGQFRIADMVSVPIGVVSLTEHISAKSHSAFSQMRDYARQQFADFFARQGDIAAPEAVQLIGTSGTVTTLAALHLGLDRYERRKVDGCCISVRDAQCVIAELLTKSPDELARIPCIGCARAAFVLAGCAVLMVVHERFPTEMVTVADRGLREGMLIQMMRADGHIGARRL